jgi:Tn3 transposase DDE domain-containing protein
MERIRRPHNLLQVRTKVLNDQLRETTVINAYAQFPLQRLWGLGKSASADGMKWDLIHKI